MVMDRRQRALYAGDELRKLRESQQLTQSDIEKRTAERFGYDARVYAQQVSRIEKGALEKPPILDLMRYGQILGLSPDDIAELYWLWPRQQVESLDPRIQQVIDLAADLKGEPVERESFLEWIRFAILQARAEQRARAAARESEREEQREEVKQEEQEREREREQEEQEAQRGERRRMTPR